LSSTGRGGAGAAVRAAGERGAAAANHQIW